jgi:hypothetical protein
MKTADVNKVIAHLTASLMAGAEVMSDKDYSLGNFKSYLDFKRKRDGDNGMIALDMETCNSITRLTLTEYRDYLQSELDKWNENPKDEDNPDGYWLHPEDVVGNMKRIKRINNILNDFGGELYGTEV